VAVPEDPPSEPAEAAGEQGLTKTVERGEPCECVVRIEADADYLERRYQERLSSLQEELALPGFRRGRAPTGLVERRMGGSLKRDVVASVVGEAYDDAVEEHELRVVAQTESPDLDALEWEPGQPLQVEFRCQVMPEIELDESQYRGLSIEIPGLEATEDLLRAETDRFVRQFATWEEVTTGGIDWDDYVEADVEAPSTGWSDSVGFYPRVETVGPFAVEGLKASLVGASVGDELELTGEAAEGSAGGGAGELTPGNTALQVKITRVMRTRVPELDDDLARRLGLSSVDEIREMIRERLDGVIRARKAEITRQMLRRRLRENIRFELPPALVDRASEEQQARMLVRLLRSGVPRDEAEKRAEESSELTRQAVERALRASLILRGIAEEEKIVVTEAEVDAQVRTFASRQGLREARARAYLEERGVVRSLRDDLREEKTLEFLLEGSQVTEIPPEEFGRRYGPERREGADGGA
jgi:trigger factor